jgi:hypothetical protein
MLQQFQPGAPGCVWVGMSGLASLWARVRSNDRITAIQRPTNHHWAVDLKIKDPDGNVLWFGTEPLANVPFGQELSDGELLT